MSGESRKLIKGAAILGMAAFISKVIGLIYRFPYKAITGDDGFYVYNQVYPIYSTLLIIATAGFPMAISKLVSERLVIGDTIGAKQVYRVSSLFLGFTGLVSFLLLFFGAEQIATWWGDPKLTLPIRVISISILIVPQIAAMRGYFQGFQNMMPTAVSQVVEQIVRVATILILAYWFMNHGYGVYYAGAGAMFGAFMGASSALFILLYYQRDIRKEQERYVQFKQDQISESSSTKILKELFTIAIPICFGAMVVPLMQLADSATVKNMLTIAHWPEEDAITQTGIYGRGMPLVLFASFFATALSSALIPSIAEAKAKGEMKVIGIRTELAIRLTLIIGLAASVGLAVLGEPINVTLWQNDSGTFTMQVLAFMTIFSTIVITSSGILQGLGRVYLPAVHMLFGVGLKIILNILLVPLWGITGAAISTVLAYGLAALLNMRSLAKYTGVSFHFRDFYWKPLLSVLIMGVLVALTDLVLQWALYGVLSYRWQMLIITIVGVLVGVLSYSLALLRTGAIVRTDLRVVPKANRLIPLLERLRLIR
ncbi:putative polysaccharide biosynthesis protein [Rubeoparvulum massiliense]|uniref:putative polysaccharide biosynthesis protein n=1 Tax=Rubeoparvulum massiliense TaxID=1631346 RepID=UPI00065E2D25|nr:polysaccharide biosynthesis protein [Rubeoparvulum massiliense]